MIIILGSVADPDPPDPHVFGPPGSGSTCQRYGSGSCSGSGSFYHHAKIVRKTLIPTILRLFLTFYLCRTPHLITCTPQPPSSKNKKVNKNIRVRCYRTFLPERRLLLETFFMPSINQKPRDYITGCRPPPPLSSKPVTAGRNHLEQVNYPPPSHWDRR